MTISRTSGVCFLRLFSVAALAGAIASYSNDALAQVIPDNTLGEESSTVVPDEIEGTPSDRIEGGATRGENLFHSFQEFNVGEGRGVYFANPEGIANILSRVTGGNPSNILGRLGVLGDANLFLINPNGILFGANASLDISGSFVGTTASGLQFGDRGLFSALDPEVPSPLMTINPSAFLFNQIPAGAIVNRSTAPDPSNPSVFGLGVLAGQNLIFVGGDVRLEGGILRAPGGRVELAGIADLASVGLTFGSDRSVLAVPENVARADISLSEGASVDVSAGGGGAIALLARNVRISGGSGLLGGIVPNSGTPQSQAGDIFVDATQHVAVGEGAGSVGQISNLVAFGALGAAGDVIIQAGSLAIAENSIIGSLASGQGDAGNAVISVQGDISIAGVNSGIISAVAPFFIGNAGNIQIQGQSLSLDRGAQIVTSTTSEGNAGNISIEVADSISVRGGSLLRSDSFGQGDSGQIRISAGGPVSLSGIGTNGVGSGIISLIGVAEIPGFGQFVGTGRGGDVFIEAQSLSISGGAQVNTVSAGQGNAGSVFINTSDRITLDGINPNNQLISNITSSVELGGVGKGGNIEIATPVLDLLNGARLSSSTLGRGDAGSVIIVATERVTLAGQRWSRNLPKVRI